MPRGIPNKKSEVIEAPKAEVKINETKEETKKEIVSPVLKKCPGAPHLASCQCQDPLSAGQAYFEDGPTGTVVIGEDSKNEILFRHGNGGRGCLINKKR